MQCHTVEDDLHIVYKFSWNIIHLYDKIRTGGLTLTSDKFVVNGIKFKLRLDNSKYSETNCFGQRRKRNGRLRYFLGIESQDHVFTEDSMPKMWWGCSIGVEKPKLMVTSVPVSGNTRGEVCHRYCHTPRRWKHYLFPKQSEKVQVLCWIELRKLQDGEEIKPVVAKRGDADKLLAARMSLLQLRDEDQGHVSLVDGDGNAHTCHRTLLSSISPVFEAMFGNKQYKEVKEAKVEMPDASKFQVEALLQYMYDVKGGKLQEDKAVALLPLAEKYDMRGLKEKCQLAMAADMDAKKVVRHMEVASTYSADTLKLAIRRWMRSNMDRLMEDPEWQKMVEKKPELALEYVLPMSKKNAKNNN